MFCVLFNGINKLDLTRLDSWICYTLCCKRSDCIEELWFCLHCYVKRALFRFLRNLLFWLSCVFVIACDAFYVVLSAVQLLSIAIHYRLVQDTAWLYFLQY